MFNGQEWRHEDITSDVSAPSVLFIMNTWVLEEERSWG